MNILLFSSKSLISAEIERYAQQNDLQCYLTSNQEEALHIVIHHRELLTILNAQTHWTSCNALLQALEKRQWPVLFFAATPQNALHLQSIYRGPSQVIQAKHHQEELAKAILTLTHEADPPIVLGSLRLDPSLQELTYSGEALSLTTQEYLLLKALMLSPQVPLTRQELLRQAWGYASPGVTRTVDVHVQRLRRKIGVDMIETVYKQGYRLRIA